MVSFGPVPHVFVCLWRQEGLICPPFLLSFRSFRSFSLFVHLQAAVDPAGLAGRQGKERVKDGSLIQMTALEVTSRCPKIWSQRCQWLWPVAASEMTTRWHREQRKGSYFFVARVKMLKCLWESQMCRWKRKEAYINDATDETEARKNCSCGWLEWSMAQQEKEKRQKRETWKQKIRTNASASIFLSRISSFFLVKREKGNCEWEKWPSLSLISRCALQWPKCIANAHDQNWSAHCLTERDRLLRHTTCNQWPLASWLLGHKWSASLSSPFIREHGRHSSTSHWWQWKMQCITYCDGALHTALCSIILGEGETTDQVSDDHWSLATRMWEACENNAWWEYSWEMGRRMG